MEGRIQVSGDEEPNYLIRCTMQEDLEYCNEQTKTSLAVEEAKETTILVK